MEELPRDHKLGGASFRPQQKLPLSTNGISENICWSGVHTRLTTNNEPLCTSYNQPLEIPQSLGHVMDFLSRSWTPSASDFLHIFSPNNQMALNINDGIEEHEEKQGEGTSKDTVKSSRDIAINMDSGWMDMYNMKGWLKGKSLTSFLRSRRQQKKNETRLQTSKIDAALSLTRLAAAIAGLATNSSLEESIDTKNHVSNGGLIACEKDMGVAVASAAALMTMVCADAAESLGAHKTHVASAVNSGLATRTPFDMIALTATAATCLRGAAILETRAAEDTYFPRNQEMLKIGAQISIVMPSGSREHKQVTVYLKHKQLILSFRKKYFGGVLKTSKQFKIINVVEENKEAQGLLLLSLKTNNGIIRLLFEDENQSSFWISTISHLLHMFNSC